MQAANLQYWLALKTEDGLLTAAHYFFNLFFCIFIKQKVRQKRREIVLE
jgi:hypothetical protein